MPYSSDVDYDFQPKENCEHQNCLFYGDLNEEIYMEYPHGLKTNEDDILILVKYIYSIVQDKCQYHKNAVEILCKLGFTGIDAGTCLFF